MNKKYTIFNEDAVKWANEYEGKKFHALLTDAPYHLQSIVKRFGKAKVSDDTQTSEKVRNRSDGYSRLIGGGFMGQKWDGGDVAFRPETWEAFSKVLCDGAFGMAFSASRNWHRMAVAIEDAGFIIHPTMFFLWRQGQGFPKATRVKGHEEFDGHRYGAQALKPAVEPIIIFQKPYSGKPVENIVATGAGALNIDGGRIPTSDEYTINRFDDGMKPFGNGAGHKFSSVHVPQSNPKNRQGVVGSDLGISGADIDKFQQAQRDSIENMVSMGRWPANLVLDEGSAEAMDLQSGHLQSGKMKPSHTRHTDRSPNGIYGVFDGNAPLPETIGDSGGASRYFYTVQSQIDEADPFLYCKKVSPKERNAGLDDMPEIMSGMSGGAQSQGEGYDKGQDIGLNRVTAKKNPHPTLKPIGLAKHLATLLLPPASYAPRRLFVPFSGVASEMCGGLLAGWDEVVGVEFDTENGYVEIAEKRLQYYCD